MWLTDWCRRKRLRNTPTTDHQHTDNTQSTNR
nr:MAG TPA: hypothetical protein [Caudoviricetes sp.]